MNHATEQVTSLPLAALAATNQTQAAGIVAASRNMKDSTLNTSLLAVLQAMDGDKTARVEVAGRALHSAYTLAAKNGNVSQIAEVIASTGKRACERGMRAALQQIGLGIAPDGTASGKGLKTMFAKEAERGAMTVDEYIDDHVTRALAIFVSIACKERAPKTEKPQAVASASEQGEQADASAAKTVTVSVADMVAKMVQLIGTGALSDDEIDTIDAAIAAVKYVPALLQPQADALGAALH